MTQATLKTQISLFVAIFCLSAVAPITASMPYTSDNASFFTVDKFVGGWSYTVEGAPEGYENGLMIIIKDGDSYTVQVQNGAGTLLGENVMVKGNTINFDVMVEGSKVAVSLTIKGNTISGVSTSSEGTYTINGEKTISMD